MFQITRTISPLHRILASEIELLKIHQRPYHMRTFFFKECMIKLFFLSRVQRIAESGNESVPKLRLGALVTYFIVGAIREGGFGVGVHNYNRQYIQKIKILVAYRCKST